MTTDSPNSIPLGPINYNCILIKLLQIECITAEKVLFNDHHYGTVLYTEGSADCESVGHTDRSVAWRSFVLSLSQIYALSSSAPSKPWDYHHHPHVEQYNCRHLFVVYEYN